jgi:hypothetical protein
MNAPLSPECYEIILVEQSRPRTDKTHVTRKDAPQLGQFVEASSAKDTAYGGHIGCGFR